ncbi:regulatory protein RecX [Salmonella enterica]|nr:regulatory protein RecX [Salmonella enterica]EBS3851055.1 regulatory protein RecX [Salmonella enterica subsp. enterica serovar Java]EDX3987256.1 regulatory protein RecX [Salmonella enterica subsp. enterica serovar 4,[5],12:b:-]EEE5613346.1 regulatory protein RecX [Salmonella enterica subsp. enterica serovar Typhimurium]EAO8767130.1 regulatory protein RecX [Salmonella enterica]
MATELNKKQSELLKSMTHESLINIIHDLIQDNKQAKSTLINGYLLSAPDVLKTIEKEYKRRAKSKRFYDYYEADAFYDELTRSIAQPLEKIAGTIPEQVEHLSVKIMLEFEKFSENSDTSSGSWMYYYSVLLDTWMKSLAAQKNSDSVFIAQKAFNFISNEVYFGCGIFKKYRALLGTDVLRMIRDMYYQKKCVQEALDISIIIKDNDFLSEALKKGEFCRSEHYFDYARLLIEKIRPGEAIELLLYMDRLSDETYSDKTTWYELFIIALIEDGRNEEAREKSVAAFSFRCDTRFYRLYIKACGKEDDNVQVFINIAKEKGIDSYICFTSDVERFDLIDDCITGMSKEELARSLAYLGNSFIRTLSSTLYKHGYALAATLLRRLLVEDAINQAKSKYYSYAASDMKKAIDYSEDLEEDPQFPGTVSYLMTLYEQHKRKTSLWPLMAEKIKGLSVGKDGICYKRSRA